MEQPSLLLNDADWAIPKQQYLVVHQCEPIWDELALVDMPRCDQLDSAGNMNCVQTNLIIQSAQCHIWCWQQFQSLLD